MDPIGLLIIVLTICVGVMIVRSLMTLRVSRKQKIIPTVTGVFGLLGFVWLLVMFFGRFGTLEFRGKLWTYVLTHPSWGSGEPFDLTVKNQLLSASLVQRGNKWVLYTMENEVPFTVFDRNRVSYGALASGVLFINPNQIYQTSLWWLLQNRSYYNISTSIKE